MAFTTTWSFGSGYEGWTFREEIVSGSGSASRTHVSGAIRVRIVIVSSGQSRGYNTSPGLINATITAGDTIEIDISATSDGVNMSTILYAYYTDLTFDSITSANNNNARTITLNLTGGKTLDYIEVRFSNQTVSLSIDHTRDLEEVRLNTAVDLTATPGVLRTPTAFIEDEGAGAAGGAGGGAGGNIADISADGLYIYIALFNSLGFPTLIKILATLSADGSVVFNPGAGGRIGVQCGRRDANVVWTAGQFDGTNTVEKSEDAAGSFSVKDDGSFGTVRTFEVGPNNDAGIIIFDGDNGDLIESIDDGATWVTRNAAVAPLVNSIARFSQNLQEIVIANQANATDNIDYSPNTGQDLEDYSTNFPIEDTTKVIVS